MSTGALLFAYNNEHTDYVALARWTADNIRRHLDIPVALVTDQDPGPGFDKVVINTDCSDNSRWFEDYGTHVQWHNATRVLSYDLSPWDQTLVLDVDYVVASDQLRVILDSGQDFLAHRWAYDVTHTNDFSGLNFFGEHNMPMWWATVMMFGRSEKSRLIFECMKMVRDNWPHYKKLYKNNSPSYRNDHALSIALMITNGHHVDQPEIIWPMASLLPAHKLEKLSKDRYCVTFANKENKPRRIELVDQDFHAMGKSHLEKIIASDR